MLIDTILVNFINGMSFGCVLFLLAAGLSLTMGLMRISNLAHGGLYMIGAYIGIEVTKFTGNFLLGIIAGAILAGLVGLILEMGFLRRLYKRDLDQVLLTIGFIYILTNLTRWIFGEVPRMGIVPSFLSGSVPLGGVTFPLYRFAIILIGLVIAAALWLLQEKTRIGAIVRAGMDNKEIIGGLGINLKVVFTGVFVLGAAVAGFCGPIGAPVLGANLAVAWDALLLAMIVVIIGGTGSVQGALAGGMIIGFVDSFGKAFFPDFAYFAMYLVLIIILLVRPSGLLGRAIGMEQTTEAAQESLSEVDKGSVEKAKSLITYRRTWRARLASFGPYFGIGLVLLVVPPFLPTFFEGQLTKIFIFAIFAMSLDLIMGYTGLSSLGHAAFFGMAGYAVGIIMIRYGIVSFWIVMPLGIIIAIILSAIIGYFALRVSGLYFLLITFAFGELLSVGAMKWRAMTGGTDGLVGIRYPALGIPGIDLTSANIYFLVFITFVVCFLLLRRITKSSYGRALVGIRENEPRMQCLGYNTWAHKYVAFIIGGAFAGVAGALYACFYGVMVPGDLGIMTSASALLMVIIGGPGTLYGPVIGAAVITLLEQFVSIYTPDRWPLILGIIFVICVMFLHGGFAGHLSRLRKRVRFEYGSLKN